MKAPWFLSIVACLAMTLIASAQFETTLQRLDRESNARMWAQAHAEMHRQIDAFNVEIDAARAKFWATYPDKPGAKEAAQKFFGLLLDKDQFYITSALSMRMSTGGDRGDELDGGIRSTAQPEFDDFIKAAQPGIPTQGGDVAAMMRACWAATDRHPDEFNVYRLERNYWEFDQHHRIPAIWDSPEKYPIYLYTRYYHLPIAAAEASTTKMFELFGKDVVTNAAWKVRNAPKSDKGNLLVTAPRPVKVGPGGSELDDESIPLPPNPIGSVASPLLAFNRLVSQDDDRRYLLYLLSSGARVDSTTIDRAHQWTFAGTAYARLVAAFGEKVVLEGAREVRLAPRAYSGGSVINPGAIGARRGDPFGAFEDIITKNNPRGYLRSTVAFAYSHDTSAAIDVAYAKLVAESGEEAWLAAARRRIKNLPNVVSALEIRSIQALVGAAPEVERPPEEMVDSPEYAMWKKYPAGTRITHVERKWMASRPRPGSYNSANPTVMVAYPPDAIVSYTLKSIDDQKAALWLTQSSAGVYGNMHPARDSELNYLAKYKKSAADHSARLQLAAQDGPTPVSTLVWNAVRTADPVESGDEIVEVKGHRIATHWESAKYTGPDFNNESGVTLVVKVWTSDAIPRGLVRRTEDKRVQHIPGQLEPARYIVETYLESFDGFALPPVTGSGPVMTAYSPPSVGGESVPAATRLGANETPRAGERRNGAVGDPALQQPAVAPAKTQPASVLPRPAVAPGERAIDTSRMPPEVAQQVALSQKYTAAAARAVRARNELLKWQQSHSAVGGSIPSQVRAARDGIPAQLQAAAVAMGTRDPLQTKQALDSLDAASAVIEAFVAR